MVEQLDRLIRESRRPNVRLGIIEWTTAATVPALHGFTIYDSRAVLLETLTATAIVTDGREVSDYENHWGRTGTIRLLWRHRSLSNRASGRRLSQHYEAYAKPPATMIRKWSPRRSARRSRNSSPGFA